MLRMNENTLYIPIKSTTLAHYFSRALIVPSQFLDNKPNDIQDYLKNSILATSYKWVEGCDCSLEIIKLEHDIDCTITDEFFTLKNPIPITHIKRIWFLDEAQKDQTIININISTAFIPDRLIEIERNKVDFINFTAKDITLEEDRNADQKIKDIERNIKKFDARLGGLAFMNVARNKAEATFSEHYLSTLSYLNKTIEYELQNAKVENDSPYLGLFEKKSDNNDWSFWYDLIKNPTKESFDQKAQELGITDYKNKTTGLINFDKLADAGHLYEIAALLTYGEEKQKKVVDLVSEINSGKLSEAKAEDVAIIFGIHHGYSRFHKEHGGFDIKFKLNSQLDYYTIESLYQYIFNNNEEYMNREGQNFSYLDVWRPKSSPKDIDEQYEYLVLDTVVKKKLTPEQKEIKDLKKSLLQKDKEIEQLKAQIEWYESEKTKNSQRLIVNESPELDFFGKVQQYYTLKVTELKKIYEQRNINIKPKPTKKEDLIKALETDDKRKGVD